MAIAHQTEVVGAANTAAGSYDTNITPAAAPNGVCVVIHQNTTVADSVTSVQYGTGGVVVPLARRRFDTEPTEPGGVYIYWAGDSAAFPSGLQTVRITRTGTHRMQAVISTMTCAAGQVVTFDSEGTGQSTSQLNPTWTHTSLVNNVMAYLGIHSGATTMTNTPAANWTLQSFTDIGAQGCGFARLTSATNTAGNRAPGWTVAADDFVGSSIAFKEAPLQTTVTGAALGALSFTGAAAGQPFVEGTAASAITFSAAASGGVPGVSGAAAANLALNAATAGVTVGWGPPIDLHAIAVSASQIDLVWVPVPGATGYDIERDGTVVVFDHPTTSYSDSGLAGSTEYDYRVRAVG